MGACQFRFHAIDTLHRDCILLDRRKGGKGIELGLEIDDDAVFLFCRFHSHRTSDGILLYDSRGKRETALQNHGRHARINVETARIEAHHYVITRKDSSPALLLNLK